MPPPPGMAAESESAGAIEGTPPPPSPPPPAPKPRRSRWLRRLLRVVMAFVVVAGIGVWQAGRMYRDPGPLAAQAQLVVPRGGTQEIGAFLQEKGVITDALSFSAAAWLTRDEGPLHAAEFVFPAQSSLAQVLDILRHARPVQRRLTIPEGLSVKQIMDLLDHAEGLTGTAPVPDEGTILPETYAYQWGDSRAAVLRRATDAMKRVLAEEWANRVPNPLLPTPRDAVILASIVERETALAEERPHVAAVFLNRLRLGMPLQSDPTAAYAVTGGLPLDRPLTRADLDRDEPFNTYRNKGLPPGPICNPGRASLHAVLHPDQSDDLYFVANGTGGHAFARTLAEHDRNVAKWRALQRGDQR